MLCEIYEMYTEPHRHYHNLNHIARMFQTAAEQKIELSEMQIWAIWFHDIIYEVGANDNEERSAEVVGKRLEIDHGSGIFFPKFVEEIKTIIRDTQDEVPTIEESKVVVDLDLWDLAAERRYWLNRDLIEKEMLTKCTMKEWKEGRAKWLGMMLDRDRIYWSEYADEAMERRARCNMEAEFLRSG